MSTVLPRLPEPIEHPISVNCPTCREAVTEFGGEPANDDCSLPWLHDADAIPSVADWVEGMAISLWVGQCRACTENYWVAEAILVPGNDDMLLDFMGGYDKFDAGNIQSQEMLAGELYRNIHWLEERSITPAGPVHTHLFGPVALTATDLSSVMSRSGVTACGKLLAGTPWARAGELVTEALPLLLARHADHCATAP